MRAGELLPRLILPLALLAGCHVGVSATRFEPARAPGGITMTAQLGERSVMGELLEVGDDSVLLLKPATTVAGARVLKVRFSSIRSARFNQLGGSLGLRDGRPPDPAAREKLRLLSRFPQGLGMDVLQRLLAAHGQARAEEITP